MNTMFSKTIIVLLAVMVMAAMWPCVCSARAATPAQHSCCSHCSKKSQPPSDCPHCKGSAFEKSTAQAQPSPILAPALFNFAIHISPLASTYAVSSSTAALSVHPPASTLLNQHCALTV